MKIEVQQAVATRSGLRVGCKVIGSGGWIRFEVITLPWYFLDDPDCWSRYSRDARRRAESDDQRQVGLPLDWS